MTVSEDRELIPLKAGSVVNPPPGLKGGTNVVLKSDGVFVPLAEWLELRRLMKEKAKG